MLTQFLKFIVLELDLTFSSLFLNFSVQTVDIERIPTWVHTFCVGLIVLITFQIFLRESFLLPDVLLRSIDVSVFNPTHRLLHLASFAHPGLAYLGWVSIINMLHADTVVRHLLLLDWRQARFWINGLKWSRSAAWRLNDIFRAHVWALALLLRTLHFASQIQVDALVPLRCVEMVYRQRFFLLLNRWWGLAWTLLINSIDPARIDIHGEANGHFDGFNLFFLSSCISFSKTIFLFRDRVFVLAKWLIGFNRRPGPQSNRWLIISVLIICHTLFEVSGGFGGF